MSFSETLWWALHNKAPWKHTSVCISVQDSSLLKPLSLFQVACIRVRTAGWSFTMSWASLCCPQENLLIVNLYSATPLRNSECPQMTGCGCSIWISEEKRVKLWVLKKKKNPYLYILTTSFWGENFCHHVCHLSCGCVISNFYLKIKCLSFVLFTATGPALVSQAHCLHPSLLPFSKDRQTGLTGLKWTSELFNETHKQVHNWSQRRGQSMTRTKQNWNVWKSSKKKSSGEYPAVNFLFYFIFKKQWSDLSILEWNTINSTHSDYAKTKWSNSEWTLTCDQLYTQYYVLL